MQMAEGEGSLYEKIVQLKSGLEDKNLKTNIVKMKVIFGCSMEHLPFSFILSFILQPNITGYYWNRWVPNNGCGRMVGE